MVQSVKSPPYSERPVPPGLTTATIRTLHSSLEATGGRAGAVARSLGEAIRLGVVQDGQGLPPEIRLADLFGVSPVTLREALAILRRQGLITTRRGRGGGTVVTAPPSWDPLHQFSIQGLRDLGDQRRAVSGMAAYLAAERGLPDELRRLEDHVRRLGDARSVSDWRRADTELSIAVAVAAQSPRLALEEASLLAEVGDLLAMGLEQDDLDVLTGERVALVSAVTGRACGRARTRAEAYVQGQTQRLVRERLRLSSIAASSSAGSLQSAPLDSVLGDLIGVFASLGNLGLAFADLLAKAPGGLSADSLAELRPAIIGLINEHDPLLTGAGIVVAPDLLVDRPLWLEWWWRIGRGPVEALRVNLDPSAPDFHDYPGSEYFRAALGSQAPYVSSPSVDYACTNEYAITLSSPVWSEGRFLGIAGADVLVASIEPLVVPVLTELDRPAALVSRRGRVIASNVGYVLPGQRVDVGEDAIPATTSGLLSWFVVDLDSDDTEDARRRDRKQRGQAAPAIETYRNSD